MDPLKATWTVTAGIIPGTEEEKFRRQYHLTASEWEEAEDKNILLVECIGSVMMYAATLQNPQILNWVHVEFIWY